MFVEKILNVGNGVSVFLFRGRLLIVVLFILEVRDEDNSMVFEVLIVFILVWFVVLFGLEGVLISRILKFMGFMFINFLEC